MAGATRGRRKKSAAEKKHSRKVIRPDHLPPIKLEKTDPPRVPNDLNEVSQAWWDANVNALYDAGFVCHLDSEALRAAAQQWAHYLRFNALSDNEELRPIDAARYQGCALKAYEIYHKITGKFGLTPQDRTKIREIDPDRAKSDSPLTAFQKQFSA